MGPELKQLREARSQLAEFEKLQGDQKGVACLSEGLTVLTEIIEGNHPEADKKVANNVLLTYKTKILGKIKDILKDKESQESEALIYWHNVMREMADFSLLNDEESAYKTELLVEGVKSILEKSGLPQRVQESILDKLKQDGKSD